MTQFPFYDTIEFEQNSTVSANQQLTGSNFDNIKGNQNLASNEIFEVERIEILPPTDSSGSLQTFDYVRLQDGTNFYPHVYMRSFMMGWLGADFGIRTPKFGVPVLSNQVSPQQRPILTACPKFGPSESVNVSLKNDGTAITGSFTIRVSGWRFKGTDQELQNYFESAGNLSTVFQQDLSLSNPFKDEGNVYTNTQVVIQKGADGGAMGQFTKLTGGNSQDFPKVYPWATWSENAKATDPNVEYSFSYDHSNVAEPYQSLYNNYKDSNNAAIFNYAMVKEDVANLKEFKINLTSRPSDEESQIDVPPNDQHQLPFIHRLDGTVPSTPQVVVQTGGPSTVGSTSAVGSSMPLEAVDRVPRRLGRMVQPSETVVWNDEGGVQVVDDGTSIPANNILIGVQGYRLELNG